MPAPHHSFLQAKCSSWCPTNGFKALKAIKLYSKQIMYIFVVFQQCKTWKKITVILISELHSCQKWMATKVNNGVVADLSNKIVKNLWERFEWLLQLLTIAEKHSIILVITNKQNKHKNKMSLFKFHTALLWFLHVKLFWHLKVYVLTLALFICLPSVPRHL